MGCDAGRFLTPSISRKEPFDPLSHRFALATQIPVGTVTLLIYLSIGVYLPGLTAGAQFVEHDSQDDDRALDNQLPVKGDVHQRKSVIQHSDDQGSDQCSKDRSNSTNETGPSQNDRRDRIQLVTDA